MIVWRIVSARHAATAFSGVGAAEYPGRWNHRNRRVGYGSDHPALAMLEILVHAETGRALHERVLVRAAVPDEAIYELPDEDLPKDWNQEPIALSTRDIGEAWRSDGVYLALSVPSVVVPFARNIVLNPDHQDFERIRFDDPVPLEFDPRLLTFR